MHRHLPPAAVVAIVAEQLVHEFVDSEAAIGQRALLAVLGHDHVAIVERRGTADHRGLLAGGLHVEAQPALALGGQAGVAEWLDNIAAEFELTMALAGCRDIADITDGTARLTRRGPVSASTADPYA